MWFILNICFVCVFFPMSLEFCCISSRCIRDKPPIKIVETESLLSFPGRQYFAGIIKCLLYDFKGTRFLELVPGFLWTLFHVSFFFINFLYPFAAINIYV